LRYKYLAIKYARRVRPDASFQNVWDSFGSWPLHAAIEWRPSADIYETPDKIFVVIELAGVSEDTMTVTLFSDLIVVEGTREQPLTDLSACHQLGIKYGNFKSEIGINVPIDHDNVKAEYKNGLLTITLQKRY
jgi:HSP20 family protein